ncbi:MAG TPA: DUF1003 domain-containing protein [Flavitalea sp.]|nr:DUF1003 domain-containing protein [Flavitalea sp.]
MRESKTFKKLLDTESAHLSKLNSIVVNAVEEERILSQKLFDPEDQDRRIGAMLADRVASFGGSWLFILSFLMFMLLWMLANLYLLSKPFDPYPFILLNLILSSIAAIQAPIIMMSQNRKEEKDRKRATNDYMINLKAEIEIRNLHEKIDLLLKDQMQTLFDMQKAQVELMEDIRKIVSRTNNGAK